MFYILDANGQLGQTIESLRELISHLNSFSTSAAEEYVHQIYFKNSGYPFHSDGISKYYLYN